MEQISAFTNLPEPTKLSERATLLKFFLDTLKDKQGKPFKPARIGIALAHLSEKDIYYLISVFKDTERRRGFEAASKEFWYSLKPKN